MRAFISPDDYHDAAQRHRLRSSFEFSVLVVMPISRMLGTSIKGFGDIG